MTKKELSAYMRKLGSLGGRVRSKRKLDAAKKVITEVNKARKKKAA